MKRLARILVLCAALYFCAVPVHASQLLDDLKESAGVDRLSSIVPEELGAFASLDESAFTDADFGRTVLERFITSLGESMRGASAFFAGILALILFSAFAGAMRYASFSDTVGDALEYLAALVLALMCYATLHSSFCELYEALKALCGFVGALLPITGAIYTLSGAATTLAAQSASMLTALAVLDAIVTSYLFPFLSLSFALAAANAVSGLKLGALSQFFRRTVSVLLTALFTVLVFILSVQTLVGAAGDTLLVRTSRFAAANFVPAVGSLFGEAAKTVFAAVGVLRASVGTLGALTVGWLLLAPLLSIAVRRALFSLAAALSEALGLEKPTQFLSECGQTLGLCLSIGLVCGVFFLIAFAVFVRVPIGGN